MCTIVLSLLILHASFCNNSNDDDDDDDDDDEILTSMLKNLSVLYIVIK